MGDLPAEVLMTWICKNECITNEEEIKSVIK